MITIPDTPDLEWWQIHDNLVLTAHYMADEGYTAKDLAYFVEKPWKHEEDFLAAEAALESDKA